MLSKYINYFVGAGFALLFLGIVAIVLQEFQTTQTSGTAAHTVLGNALGMFSNLTGQLPTVGKVAGVLALLVVIGLIGLFGYQKVKSAI